MTSRIQVWGGSAIRFMEANLLILLFVCAVFVLSVNRLQEFDAWFHLKTGEYIVTHLTVPTHDIFSYTAQGAEWVTHSWLPEVFFFLVYKACGFWGLVFLAAAMSAATFYLVIRIANRWVKNRYIPLFSLFILPFLNIWSLWIPRPQIFSYLLVVAEILLLERYLETKNKRLLWWLLGLFLFWANAHASIVLGFAILAVYLCFARELWKYAIAALALSFLNPNTYKIFIYQFMVEEVSKTLRVEEWSSIWSYRAYPGTQVFFVLLVAVNIWCVISALRSREGRDVRFAMLLAGFSVLPFVSVRHIGYFPLVAFPILAAKIDGTKVVSGLLGKISENAVKMVLVLFMLLIILSGILHWPANPVNGKILPVKAVDFIEAQGIKGPVLNLYNEGGYLIWRLWPDQKVFFDGRAEIYRGAPLKEFLSVTRFSKDWSRIVNDKYHINYFLIPYMPKGLLRYAEVSAIELSHRGFRLVYVDDAYLIFVRDSAENAQLIKRFGIDPKEFIQKAGR